MDLLLDRVREVARLKNMTSGRLAKETGISPSTIHYLMHKGKRPTPETKKILKKWLDKAEKDVSGNGEPKPVDNKDDEWRLKVVKALKSLSARVSKLEQEVSRLLLN